MTATKSSPARRPSATPRHSTSSELLTVEQAADYLNITEHFVRRLIQERRLPFVRVGRLVRMRRSALDAWLTEAEVPARVTSRARRGARAS